MSSYSMDVHIYMERGAYGRLVDRAQELGVPLSAVVRDAIVKYFEDIPEVSDQGHSTPQPEDPIWQVPELSRSFGALNTPHPQGGAK